MKKELKFIEKGLEDQVVYIGLDDHKNQWKVAIYTSLYEYKVFSQSVDPGQLYRYLTHHFPGWRYVSVYEAGFSGFWIHESLQSLGIESYVINPADLPESQKDRRRKNDKRDARNLARALRAGTLVGIYCPDRAWISLRALVRHRSKLVQSQTRWKNRIKSYLAYQGILLPQPWSERNWSGRFLHWLDQLLLGDTSARYTLDSMLEMLRSIRDQIRQVNQRLRHLAKDPRHQWVIQSLMSVPGIGMTSAWVIYTELIDPKRFARRDHLHSYCGLVPDLHQSADRSAHRGITSRANLYLRAILIEVSWHAIRKDPALQIYYRKAIQRMKGQQAIVKVAKKLLNRIRYVWIHQETYTCNYA